MTSAWRKAKNHGFTALAGLALAVALVPLASITWYVAQKGAPGLSWSLLAHAPTFAGDPSSGIGPAIQGTAILVLLAALLGIPLGIAGGLWLSEHGRRRLGYAFRLMLDAMAATPSIVTGIFVFTVLVLAQGHYSALAGGVALAIMVVPVVARTSEVALRAVPDTLREAGVALGATHSRTLFRVVLPTARGGILTGAILATARVAGEIAPLLFTALFAQQWFRGLGKPIMALPTFIFNAINQPDAASQQQAWSAALLLFVLVFGANLLVRAIVHLRSDRP